MAGARKAWNKRARGRARQKASDFTEPERIYARVMAMSYSDSPSSARMTYGDARGASRDMARDLVIRQKIKKSAKRAADRKAANRKRAPAARRVIRQTSWF